MKRLFFYMMAIMTIVACTDSGGVDSGGNSEGGTNEPAGKSVITLSDDKLEIPSAGRSEEFKFTSTAKWSAEVVEGSDWCVINPTSGKAGEATITIETQANESYDNRYAVISIKTRDDEKILQVVQVQHDAIVVADYEYEVESYGGELDFEIQANVDISVNIEEDWIKQVTTRAMMPQLLHFDIAPTTSEESREGVITITGGNAEPQIITVKQKGVEVVDYSAMPNNEIWYVSSTNKMLELDPLARYNTTVVSHTYENGRGVIRFARDLTTIDCSEQNSKMFTWMEHLVEICLPQSVTTIKRNPFYQARDLRAFYGKFASDDNRCLIYNGVLVAFAPSGVQEYTTPDGLTAVGERAFYRNEELKKITFSEGIESIGDEAFMCDAMDNTQLEYVNLPSTLNELGGYVFLRCKNIKKFAGNNKFVVSDGYALVIEGYSSFNLNTIVSFAVGSDLTSFVIPEGVEMVESYAFAYAKNLREVTFPNSLTALASGACFEHADNIEKIYGANVADDNRSLIIDGELEYVAPKGLVNYTTPAGVTKLGFGSLNDKPELKHVTFSDDVLAVGSALSCRPYAIPLGYIVHNCPNLESVTISANMMILGMDPFGVDMDSVPNDLQSIYLRAPIPPVIGYNFPDEIPTLFKNLTIYVPEQSLEAYLSSPDWQPYKGYIKGYEYTDLPESDVYVSTDYSSDGEVVTLQTATKGNGIDIVLMGDAFSDREIADGTYADVMTTAAEQFFAVEPYKSFKDHFNVHYVNVVSATEGYDYGNTALDGYFGNGTMVGGSDESAFRYAEQAIGEKRMDEALIVVMMNSTAYAGTCYMYAPDRGDWGSGVSVSYFPIGESVETLAQLLHHEAGGHGFSKLGDEYAYDYMGTIPGEVIAEAQSMEYYGWYKNVDFTSDPTQVKWSHFLTDERYAGDGLSVYEGAYTYWLGAYRPTENSIMRYNVGGFNAPSREAIYYRIHKLAYSNDWKYDYEEFVEWDAKNRVSATATRGIPYRLEEPNNFQPTHPPVVIKKSWREAMNE